MSIGKLYGKILPNVTIESAGSEGLSLTRVDGQVVFVKYGVPGDVADIKLFAKKKKVLFAHFGVCGGCKWQQMDYTTQLIYKNQQVVDAFERIGKIDCKEWMPIIGAPNQREYRNKLEYAFSNKRWLMHNEQIEAGDDLNAAGFHIAGRFDKILDINRCHLQDDLGNQIRIFIKEFGLKNDVSFYDIKAQTGFLRNVIIRNTSLGQCKD
jgi:23S rRNA (uracil1939-C5)-methyltransferase